MGNAGRVLMIPKGDYNAATTYEMLDCVYYNGRSYVCKQTSTGNAPTNTTYWQVMTPDSSAEIQALTNKLEDEAETRAELGAHNLLEISATNETKNGITFTVNEDKTITVSTGSGGSTALTQFRLNTTTKFYPYGNFILTGCPVGGSFSTFDLRTTTDNDEHESKVDIGNGVSFSRSAGLEDGLWAIITIREDQVLTTPITFKPMIRLATDTDTTYQPYAKTNVELTQDTTYKTGSFAAGESGFFHSLTIKQFGKVVTINGYVQNISPVGNTPLVLGTVSGVDMPPLDLRATAAIASAAYEDPSQMAYLTLTTSGELKVRCENAATNVAAYFSVSYIV